MWRNPQYKPVARLGVGYQSVVWEAEDVTTQRRVSVKATDLDRLDSPKALRYLAEEQACLLRLRREVYETQDSDTISTFGEDAFCNGDLYIFPRTALRVPNLLQVFYEDSNGTNGPSGKAVLDGTILGNSEATPATPLALRKKAALSDRPPSGILYFVFEFIVGEPLNKHILMEKGLSEERTRFHAAEVHSTGRIVRVLGALHERGYIYRDLKASNVIVQPHGRVMLIDFGFTFNIAKRSRARSFCGTIHAMAPEIFESSSAKQKNKLGRFDQEGEPSDSDEADVSEGYGVAVDWWALGILIYEMIYCRPPFGYRDCVCPHFKQQTIRERALKSPQTLEFPLNPPISSDLKDLLIGLLQANPVERLGFLQDAEEIQDAAWFQGFKWKELDDFFAPGPTVHRF